MLIFDVEQGREREEWTTDPLREIPVEPRVNCLDGTMGALTSVVTASEHQLMKDCKKGKAKKPTPARVTSRGRTAHGDTTAVISSGLSGLVPAGSAVSQSVSPVNAGGLVSIGSAASQSVLPLNPGRKTAVKRKAASDELRESLPGSRAKRPLMPRKKAAGTSQAASPQLGLSDQKTKELPPGPPLNTLGICGVPVSSGLTGVPAISQTACIPAALSMSAPAPLVMLPKVSEGAPGLVTPEFCDQVKAKSVALDATRCCNCSFLRCNGQGEGTNGMADGKLKLKVQLFPFDDSIKEGLEQEGRNPHLELIVPARKSISSVVHHLGKKWGCSTVASGELHLFPSIPKGTDVSACQSWSSQDLNVSVADVLAALGSPAVFRLRYAWLSSRVLKPFSAVLQQREIPAYKISEPVLPEGTCNPTPIDSITQGISVLPKASVPREVGVANSTVISTDPCRPSEQIPSLPVSESVPSGDAARQSAVPANTILRGALRKPSVRPIVKPKQPAVGRSRRAKKAPAVPAESQSQKMLVPPALDVANLAARDSEYVVRSKRMGLDNTSEASDCAWLCGSNDGFSRQPWNCEDTFRSICTPSVSQMEWVNSLPDLSVSQLLGEASRPVSSAPLDNLQPSSGQTQLNCVDSFDIAMGGQERSVSQLLGEASGAVSSSPLDNLQPSSGQTQLNCVDSFDIAIGGQEPSVSQIFGEASGAVSSAPLDNLQPSSGQTQLNCADSVDIAMGGQEPALTPSTDPSAVIFCGEDTCDAFSFQRLDQHSQDIVNSFCEEFSGSLPGLDIQDLLFDGEVSTGIEGLMEALAQGSLDEFQACTVSNDGAERDHNKDVSGQARESTAESSSIDGRGLVTLAEIRELFRIDELSSCNSELVGLRETTLPTKKDRFPPQRLFMLPGQYGSSQESAVCIAGV